MVESIIALFYRSIQKLSEDKIKRSVYSKNGTKLYHKEGNVQFIVLIKYRLASKVI